MTTQVSLFPSQHLYVGIPRIYCVCAQWEPTSKDSKRVEEALSLTIQEMNKALSSDRGSCFPLQLKEVCAVLCSLLTRKVLVAESTEFGKTTAYNFLFSVESGYEMIFRSVVTFNAQEKGVVQHIEQHTEYWKNIAEHCAKGQKIHRKDLCSCIN